MLDSHWLEKENPRVIGNLELLSEKWFRLLRPDWTQVPLTVLIDRYAAFDAAYKDGVSVEKWHKSTVADAVGFALCVYGRMLYWQEECEEGNQLRSPFFPEYLLQCLGKALVMKKIMRGSPCHR